MGKPGINPIRCPSFYIDQEGREKSLKNGGQNSKGEDWTRTGTNLVYHGLGSRGC